VPHSLGRLLKSTWDETAGYWPTARNNIMSTVTIEEAQANLPEIIDKLAPGEELIITQAF
jgi:hypothetical protein